MKDMKVIKNLNTLTCLVFRTSIRDRKELLVASKVLDKHPGIIQWNVDMEDWERVLRIECVDVTAEEILEIFRRSGLNANQMET